MKVILKCHDTAHACSVRDSHRFQMAAREVIRPNICVATLHPEPPTVSHCPCWFCVRECLEGLGLSRDATGLVLELIRPKISVEELVVVVKIVFGNAGQNYCPCGCGEERWVCSSGLANGYNTNECTW